MLQNDKKNRIATATPRNDGKVTAQARCPAKNEARYKQDKALFVTAQVSYLEKRSKMQARQGAVLYHASKLSRKTKQDVVQFKESAASPQEVYFPYMTKGKRKLDEEMCRIFFVFSPMSFFTIYQSRRTLSKTPAHTP